MNLKKRLSQSVMHCLQGSLHPYSTVMGWIITLRVILLKLLELGFDGSINNCYKAGSIKKQVSFSYGSSVVYKSKIKAPVLV